MATITDIIQSTRNEIFLEHLSLERRGCFFSSTTEKNCCSFEGTLSRQIYQISRWHSGVILFCFFESQLMQDKSFHMMHNVITSLTKKQHFRKTRNKRYIKQTVLNSRIPYIVALLDIFFLTMKSDRLKCQVHPVGDAFPFLLGLPSHLASRSRSSEKLQCPEGAGISLMWRAFKRRFNLLLARILQNTVNLDGSSFTMWTSYSTKVALLDDETSEQHNEKEKWNE